MCLRQIVSLSVSISLLFALWLVPVGAAGPVTAPYETFPTLEERVRDSGMNPEYNTWRAQRIVIPGTPTPNAIEDYATTVYGKPWDFEKGDNARIDEFGPGLLDRKIADGIFSFTVGEKGAYFAWGNYDGKHPQYGDEKFGFDQRCHRIRTLLFIRLRQSAETSTWKVGTDPKRLSTVKVKGKDWQVIQLKLTFPRKGGTPVVVFPGDEGNRVEIDWIKVARPSNVRCYRKGFILPAGVRLAKLSIWGGGRSNRIWVNGRLAHDSGRFRGYANQNFEITRYLKAGANTLALALEGQGWWQLENSLVAEGIIFCTDGSIVRILTDETWKVGWDLAPGWEQPKGDTSAMVAPELGLPTFQWPPKGDDYNFVGVGPSESNLPMPPHYGPINTVKPVGMSQPIFDEGKPIALAVALMNAPKGTLSYEIMDEFTRKVIDRGQARLRRQEPLDQVGEFRHAPVKQGCYRIRFVLSDAGKELDRRDYEIAVVGPIEQPLVEGKSYEEGMNLKLVWEVDCTQEPEPGTFASFTGDGKLQESRVVEGPAGRYREVFHTPSNVSMFGYQFRVEHPWVPHVAVIEWPDDAQRRFQVEIIEETPMFGPGRARHYWGYGRGTGGVTCLPDHPRTNKMQKLYILYWPNEQEETILVQDPVGGKAPAAAARISIYEITNEIPALRIKDFQPGARLLGVHAERGPSNCTAFSYAGPLGAKFFDRSHCIWLPESYRNWYTNNLNLIKKMRFSGQNMFLMGQFMYTGTMYPSQYGYDMNGPAAPPDIACEYGALMMRMFEQHDMGFISGFEFGNIPELSDSYLTPEELRAGKPTLLSVSRHGTFAQGWFNGYMVNFLHPEVQKVIYQMTDELIALYQEYPAWKGMGFILDRWLGPLIQGDYSPRILEWGYEDYSIELFQKKTGIKIPIPPQDPDRFQKRYEWLMANARERWIQFRCDEITALYREIAQRLRRARPDLRVFLFFDEPLGSIPEYADMDETWGHPEKQLELVRHFGFDPPALKKIPGVSLSWTIRTLTASPVRPRGPHWGVARDLCHSQDWQNFFANDGVGATYVHIGFTEWSFKPPKDIGWPYSGKYSFVPATTCYLWPPGDYAADYWTNQFVRTNPTAIAHTWCDSNLPGNPDHELRLFARAYRTLPNGKYQRLTGNGLDTNIWIASTQVKDEGYCYAANTNWWELEVNLRFAPGSQIYDLIADQPVKLDPQRRWTFHLRPYGIQTFRVVQGKIEAASAQPREAERPQVMSHLDDALGAGSATLARGEKKGNQFLQSDQAQPFRRLESLVKEASEKRQAGDLSSAYQVATSWRFLHNIALTANALETIPWRIIGPFANTGRAGFDQAYGPEADFLAGQPYRGTYPADQQKLEWKQVDSELGGEPGFVDLLELWKLEHVVAYAATEVHAPQACGIVFHLGSDDGFRLFVNGKMVGESRPARGIAPDQNQVPAQLQAGWNRILLKVDQVLGAWAFYCRVTDETGKPIDELQYRTPAVP